MIFGWSGWEELALQIVTLMLALAGIVFGIGVAINSSKLKRFGAEEIAQGIVNAAILGASVSIISLISLSASSFFPDMACGNSNESISWVSCRFSNLSYNVTNVMQKTVRFAHYVGYYQSIVLKFDNALSIQPLQGLYTALSSVYTSYSLLGVSNSIIGVNLFVFASIASISMAYLFPIGLILRSFFATRRLGAFLIAVSFGLFVVLPIFILPFAPPTDAINDTNTRLNEFINNIDYVTIPIIDLNTNAAISQKIDNLSLYNETSPGFIGDVNVIVSSLSYLAGQVLSYVIFIPLFSIIITVVFVKELTAIVGSEIGIFPVINLV